MLPRTISLAAALAASALAADILDVSGARRFWRVIDGVRAGAISPDSGRMLLAAHPGYEQIDRSGSRRRVIHHCLRLLVPGARRDTIAVPPSNRAWLYPYVCDHLDSVQAHRRELEEFTTALATDRAEQARIATALDSALAYLVPAAREVEMPTIYGMFFEPGGFGGRSIAVDLLRHMQRTERERIDFFAHELHHALMSRLPPDLPSSAVPAASPVPWWLGRLQWEGIASLIDKRSYVRRSATGLTAAPGVTGFPLEHATRLLESPVILAGVDSALTVRARATAPAASADSALRRALESAIPDGGHALGQYMALAIEAFGGRAAIVEATASRGAFIRAYQQAAREGEGFARPFSAEAEAELLRALLGTMVPK